MFVLQLDTHLPYRLGVLLGIVALLWMLTSLSLEKAYKSEKPWNMLSSST